MLPEQSRNEFDELEISGYVLLAQRHISEGLVISTGLRVICALSGAVAVTWHGSRFSPLCGNGGYETC